MKIFSDFSLEVHVDNVKPSKDLKILKISCYV